MYENMKEPMVSETPLHQNFTSILRLTSGQDTEPDLILVEHSYARPYDCQLDSLIAKPRKTLFLTKLPKPDSGSELIDVEKEFPDSSTIPAFDLSRGKHLMGECERHVAIANFSRFPFERDGEDREETDWEEFVNKTGWTDSQHNLFNKAVKILDSDRLARLTLKDTVSEPLKRRAQIDKTASKFRQCLGRVNWDFKLTHWLHNILFQNLSTPYLAAYLDILQTLKSKIPNLVDKMISSPTSSKIPNIEAINFLLKRPWDPAAPLLNDQKPSKLERMPIVIQVPSGSTSANVPQASRRIRFFNSQLQHLVKSVPVSVSSESDDPGQILEQIMHEVRVQIAESKAQYPSQPIVLLGWGIGSILACYISLIEKVSSNICLGFPMEDHEGKRGGTDDPLLGMTTPTLFIVGDKAENTVIEDLEKLRSEMKAESSLVVISGTDQMLRMFIEKRYWDGLTQSMVDRCIVEEIGDFLTRTLTEKSSNINNNVSNIKNSLNHPSIPSSSSVGPSTSHSGLPLPLINHPSVSGKLGKKDSILHRKRKLSPSPLTLSSEPPSTQPPTKTMRTGTAISQTLGLKIPVGVSSVASLMKQDSSKTFSSFHIGGDIDNMSTTDRDELDKTDKFRVTTLTKSFTVDSLASTSKQFSTSYVTPATTSTFDIKSSSLLSLNSSGGNTAPPIASIPLGSLASLTRQRYQQMIQNSESSDMLEDSYITTSSGLTSKGLDWKGMSVGETGKKSKTEDVNICGLNSVATTQTSGVSVSYSGGKTNSDGSRSQDAKHTTSKPVGSKRGRPPGRPKGSTNSSKAREKEINSGNSSKAVLTLSGASGDGVETAGKGLSSLGRGILTLCKGGTSNVRVFSASNQKTSQAGSSLPGTSSVSEGQKSRGFFLTKITSSKLNEGNGSLAIAGRVMTSSKITIPDDGKKQTTVITSSSPGTGSPTPLNLQGISASRAVPFGTSRPTTVMLLSSTVTATTSTTTTTISSGGLKTTKSIIGLKPTLEGTRLIKDAKFTIISSEERMLREADSMTDLQGLQGKTLSEYGSDASLIDITGNEGKINDPSGLVFNTSQEMPTDFNTVESESNSDISSKPTKTIVLGTKVIATSSNQSAKPSITFINSKTLNKVFSTSEPLQIKPFIKGNTGCTLIKVPQKGSSIRLVRSVGGTQHPFPALKGSKGNIVTKTFTINTKPLTKSEGSTSKRRISLDSSLKSVTKRSRGTSTDHIPEDILSNTDVKDISKSKSVESGNEKKSFDKSCVTYSQKLGKNISLSKSCEITSDQHPKENPETDSTSLIGEPSTEAATYTISSTKPSNSEERISIPKVKSSSKGQLISQSKDTLNTSIKVTKELLTSSLISEDIILPSLTKAIQADAIQKIENPTTRGCTTQKIENPTDCHIQKKQNLTIDCATQKIENLTTDCSAQKKENPTTDCPAQKKENPTTDCPAQKIENPTTDYPAQKIENLTTDCPAQKKENPITDCPALEVENPTTDCLTRKIKNPTTECYQTESSLDTTVCENTNVTKIDNDSVTNIKSVTKIDPNVKPKDFTKPLTDPIVLLTPVPNFNPDISHSDKMEEKSELEPPKPVGILKVSKFYSGTLPSLPKKLKIEIPKLKSEDSNPESQNEVLEDFPHKSDYKTDIKDTQSTSHKARRESLNVLKAGPSSAKGGKPNRVTRSTIKTISKSQKRRLRSSI